MPRPRLRLRHPGLPRRLAASGLFPPAWALLERDLRPTRAGRLWTKVLVFDTPAHLRRAWRAVTGNDLGRGCLGAVNGLSCEVWDIQPGRADVRRVEVDPRYFALCFLSVGHLTMEVLSHEAVHLGYCYAKRVEREIFKASGGFDEERIAYPAGCIAAALNRAIHAGGLYS